MSISSALVETGPALPPGNTAGTRRRGRSERIPHGWNTTDEQEVTRRRHRGEAEVTTVTVLEPEHGIFGCFDVRSATGGAYEVEIRSVSERTNTCGCVDFRVNGLGTCKHIEGVLSRIPRHIAASNGHDAASSRVEIFRPGDADLPIVVWPGDQGLAQAARRLLARHLDGSDRIVGPAALAQVCQAVEAGPPALRRRIRLSRSLGDWAEERRRQQAQQDSRDADLTAFKRMPDDLGFLKLPLLPYQRGGVAHLAFTERALLADEMGLGKTIQAIAACTLLRKLGRAATVLVVSPASLKGEWQEQVARFTDLESAIVSGGRHQRLARYREPLFFNLAGYEQVTADHVAINELLRPDIVILDEAQRIKNWETKTARAIKKLRSRYAFVLTGTPIENRIDEIYSIVQFLDPSVFGPLFRFNRLYYQFDDRGRPIGVHNLDDLGRRLAPLLLRRRKEDVEGELPPRTTKTYFSGMTDEQRARHDDYELRAARIARIAEHRPLTRDEFEKLQQYLACMRMICDTPAILDPSCRDSPKLEEFERVMADYLAEPDRKLIIFSEWVTMLEMAGELLHENGIEFARHTGAVAQDQRRREVARFKTDPDCRVLLSTESGGVGLNLQAATVVVNLDIPWNPAKLEQRIARAWRKHQTRPVTVLNFVTEHSIEHRMLSLLAIKRQVAAGVLDGEAATTITLRPGRASFVERVAALLKPAEATPAARPATLAERLVQAQKDKLLLVTEFANGATEGTLLAVVDGDAQAASRRLAEAAIDGETPRHIEVIDRATHAAIARLVEAGIIQFTAAPASELHRAAGFAATPSAADRERVEKARQALSVAERKLRMARLLASGGFAEEVRVPAFDTATAALRAVAVAKSLPEIEARLGNGATNGEIASLLTESRALPEGAIRATAPLFQEGSGEDDPQILLAAAAAAYEAAAATLAAGVSAAV